MEQLISCRNGRCIDKNNLRCEERFDDIIKITECELLEEE